ncbi:hypothetical protein [Falsiroseomonas sp.]|uniref:hypothetical protein n=1 Tax=Falsiroseomonas sp. TaxID=2870721 RepID=UPI003F6EB474
MADIEPTGRVVVDITEDVHAPQTQAPASAAGAVPVLDDDPDAIPARAEVLPDGTVRLPLLFPVTLRYRQTHRDAVREEPVDALTFHRLNGADLRAVAAATPEAQTMVALARSARIPERRFGLMFDQMDAADIGDAQRCVAGFLGNGRKTGR